MKFNLLLGLAIVITLFSLSFTSAFNFDNVKSFHKDNGQRYGTVTIKNAFGLGSNLESIELLDNTASCSDDCYAIKNITLYSEGKLIDSVKFIGDKVRTYQFYIQTGRTEMKVPDYKVICTPARQPNGTIMDECRYQQTGTHKEYTSEWTPYNYETKPAGNYIVKLAGTKSPKAVTDWVITSQGVEITDFSIWGAGGYFNVSGGTSNGQNGVTSGATRTGWKIIMNTNWTLHGAYEYAGQAGEEIFLEDSSRNILRTATISGDLGQFATDYTLVAGKEYYITVNATPTWQASRDSLLASTYPINKYYFNITASVDNGNTESTTAGLYAIQSLLGQNYTSFVTLNSPVDNYISPSSAVTFNATANVVGGATLVNMSLWTNSTGTWALNQTQSFIKNEQLHLFLDNNLNNAGNLTYSISASGSPSYGTGKINQAIELTSNNVKYITVGDGSESSLNFTGDFSISLWINATSDFSGTSAQPMVTKGLYAGAGAGGWGFSLRSGGLVFHNETGVMVNAGTVNRNLWNFLTVTRNNGNVTIYINGAVVGSTMNIQNYSNPSSVEIGRRADGVGTAAIGSYDDVRIYSNYALTQSEVSTLYNSGTGTQSSLSSPSGNAIFNLAIPNGNVLWNVQACDSDNACGFATNRTVSIDTTAPIINIISPTTTIPYGYIGENISLNYSVTDNGILSACWFVYNNTNYTTSCLSNSSFILANNAKTLTLYANDSAGNVANKSVSWNYNIFDVISYNSSAYETSSESFSSNVSSDNLQTVQANLVYDGIIYATTKVGDNNNMVFTKTLDIPLSSSVTNKSFYWQYLYGATSINGTIFNQTVNPIVFRDCNSTITVPYINYTFQDETSLASVSGTISNMVATYYIGSGSVTKTMTFQNTTDNPSYAFCLSPTNKAITVSPLSFTYGGTGYASRYYSINSQSLTNTTSNVTLYQLSSSAGITTSIQTVDTAQVPVSGVNLVIERQINNIWTTIGTSVTDNSGLASFFVNPNFQIRVTGTKTGYTTAVQTIIPTQSVYTLIMSGSGGNSGAYNGTLEGMKWTVSPITGITNISGAQIFSFNITASLNNLVGCKIELIRSDTQAVIATGTGSGTSNCYASTNVALPGVRVFGRLSIITTATNGQYEVIDSDAMWYLIETDVNQASALTNFFSQMKNFAMFGTEQNHKEYTRIVVFFIFLIIIMGIFSYFTQYDTIYPGIGIFLVWALIIFADWGGWFNLYFGNVNGAGVVGLLANGSFLQQWILTICVSLFLLGYIINYWAGRVQQG